MKKVNQLKAGVILSYASMIVTNIISIIYTPIMLRLLGKSEYGLYSLVSSVVSNLSLLNLGFSSAFMRFYSKYKVKDDKEGMARLNGMFLIIFSIIGLITVIVGSILVFNVENIFERTLSSSEISTARVLMTLMVFNMAISFPDNVLSSNITANECYLFQRSITLLRAILNPFLTLPLLLMGYKSISLVLVTTLLTVVGILLNIWYSFKKLKIKFIFNNFDFSLLKQIWAFSFFIFLNMITDQINWSVDKFILGMVSGTTVVAVYTIGAQINHYYLTFSSSISSVFIPKVNRIVAKNNDNNELTRLFTKVGRIQFIVMSFILTSFVIFGKYFISVWAGEGYETSYYIALILIVPVTIPLIQNVGIEIQKAKNMHRFRSVLYVSIALCNILLSIPLAKAFGGVGSAIGTSIAILVANCIIMNIYYHKKVGLDMIYFWNQIGEFVPALIIPIIAGAVIMFVIGVNSIPKFILLAIVYSCIFVFSMWKFGMNNTEKDLFRGPINKILRRK